MPCRLRFEGRVVLARFDGAVTSAEIADLVNDVASHPQFDEQRFLIVDCRDATLPALDESLLLATAPLIGATLTNRSLALVVVPDSDATRQFAEFCRPTLRHVRLHFAPDVEAAVQWIHAQTTSIFPPLR